MKELGRIFLSYVHEDALQVTPLYHRLIEAGFSPWMDRQDISPGELVHFAIAKAIRNSDVFLVCLSRHSVNTRGGLQSEINMAMDLMKDMLHDGIYLIPARLEACEVPEELQVFQRVDLFEKDGWSRLVQALRMRAERRRMVWIRGIESLRSIQSSHMMLGQLVRHEDWKALAVGVPASHILPQQFLEEAGFTTYPVDPFGFLCRSQLRLWTDLSPLYVRVIADRALDLQEFQSLCTAATEAYGEDVRDHTAVVVIDAPPRLEHLHHIFALRASPGLTIVPLPRLLMAQARRDGRAMAVLREQVDLYTGHMDLYDIRTAVTDALSFFGHEVLLADLQRRLSRGQSVALFGLRKVGKSSVLSRLREECRWPVALVDLQAFGGRVQNLYADVLRSWWAVAESSFPDMPLPDWVDNCAALDEGDAARLFCQTVDDLLRQMARQPNKPGLLLFLDEIDSLVQQPAYLAFAAVLRGIAENSRNKGRFALLVAGLEPRLNRVDHMPAGRNPFFAFFNEMPMPLLETEDTQKMILSLGGQMGIAYQEEALDYLGTMGGGHPFLTRQLCSQTIRGLKRPVTVDLAHAQQAVNDYLHLPDNYLVESLWGLDTGGPPAAEAALLMALAATQPQAEVALLPTTLPLDEKRAWHMALQHLRDHSVIRHAETGWELTIPLYRRWIRYYMLQQANEAGRESRG